MTNPAELKTYLFVRPAVWTGERETTIASGLVEHVEDAPNSAVRRDRKVDTVAGQKPHGAADRALEDGFRHRVKPHGMLEGVPGDGGGQFFPVEEVVQVSSDRRHSAFDNRRYL